MYHVDVVEGQNLYDYNEVTLHTEVPGCTQAQVCNDDMTGSQVTRPDPACPFGATCPPINECHVPGTPQQHYECPIQEKRVPNLGRSFNQAGGGYAPPITPPSRASQPVLCP